MSFGQKVINAIENRRDKMKRNQPGAAGQFWRDGGEKLLYDLPVLSGELVIDAGGYKGQWTVGMISRYGCSSQVFEPVPEFYEYCLENFKHNKFVQVHKCALGSSDRKTSFNFLDNGTSEYKDSNESKCIEVEVIDVARLFTELGETVACMKLNIEGGEYDVLERMIETNNVAKCNSLLIQFHRQPHDYAERYNTIVSELRKTHVQSWCYEMIWEKWVRK